MFEFSGRSVYDARAIDVPTALIRGELDRTSTEADARLLLDQLGSAAKVLETVPAGGHFMQLELCAPRVHKSVLRALAMFGG